MARLEKAYLEIEGGGRLVCLYNPATLRFSRSTSWTGESMPGRGVPTLRFAGNGSAELALDLTFDTTDTGRPVTEAVNRLEKLLDVDPRLPGSDESRQNVRPPTVTFCWGQMSAFRSVVTSISISYTYFSSSGTPLRASVALSLRQYEETHRFGPQNPTSGTPSPQRTHRIQPGETLDRISARYYGDPTRWRVLATANGLSDPLALRPGRLIDIPRPEGD